MRMILSYDATYFNPAQTLECGQIFRFRPYKKGYMVFSKDKACYLYEENGTTYMECDDGDYFYNFFDLGRDYASIIKKAQSFSVPILSEAAKRCSGLRLLNQDAEETIFSFIISQNNNIPRIKKIIENICLGLGETREFAGEKYFSFPKTKTLAERDESFFAEAGAGYRSRYLSLTARRLTPEVIDNLRNQKYPEIRNSLLSFTGIGEKVADCISLFAFKRTEAFPVDTWIEKLYREDFGGTLKDRKKISAYFTGLFGEYSGYVQQYLFYAKRENF